MGREAATKALLDAGITYDKVQQVWTRDYFLDNNTLALDAHKKDRLAWTLANNTPLHLLT